MREAIGRAVEHVTTEISNLRAVITELRPAALDQLGLLPALTSLVHSTASTTGLEVDSELKLGSSDARLAPELETTVYRLVQEALTNVVKHAGAQRVSVRVDEAAGWLDVVVADDGRGLRGGDTAGTGFGLLGMRERVELADGALHVEDGEPRGTVVRARFPVPDRAAG
jgi:signal transduction histidine kinase